MSQEICKIERDSLTNTLIYTSAEVQPENAGGPAALMREYNKLRVPIPEDLDTKFVIAFIVDTAGRISGERILRDKTDTVGKQMIQIAKSMKWQPAICYGKKISMLHQLQLRVCLESDN